MSNLLLCPLCQSASISSEELPLRGISHSSFEPIRDKFDPITIYQCNNCTHIFKIYTESKEAKLKRSFHTEEYYKSQQTLPKIPTSNQYLCLERETKQISIIQEIMNTNNLSHGNFLDYGCNHGDLVLLAQDKMNLLFDQYFGLDISLGGKKVSSHANTYFIDDLDYVPDNSLLCVVFSHSLFYIKDLGTLFRRLKEKMSRHGFIVIQFPNYLRSSIYLLDDQYHFFQPCSIASFLNRFGFDNLATINAPDSSEVIVVASEKALGFDKQLDDFKSYQGNTAYKIRSSIETSQKIIKEFVQDENTAVLGKTSSASLVLQTIRDQVLLVCDKNCRTNDITFYGKRVTRSFDSVVNCSRLIVPIFKVSSNLQLSLDRLTGDIQKLIVEC